MNEGAGREVGARERPVRDPTGHLQVLERLVHRVRREHGVGLVELGRQTPRLGEQRQGLVDRERGGGLLCCLADRGQLDGLADHVALIQRGTRSVDHDPAELLTLRHRADEQLATAQVTRRDHAPRRATQEHFNMSRCRLDRDRFHVASVTGITIVQGRRQSRGQVGVGLSHGTDL